MIRCPKCYNKIHYMNVQKVTCPRCGTIMDVEKDHHIQFSSLLYRNELSDKIRLFDMKKSESDKFDTTKSIRLITLYKIIEEMIDDVGYDEFHKFYHNIYIKKLSGSYNNPNHCQVALVNVDRDYNEIVDYLEIKRRESRVFSEL